MMTISDYSQGNTPSASSSGLESSSTLLTDDLGADSQSSSRDTGASARAQIREVKDQVLDRTRGSIRQARDRAADSLSESRRRAADQIGSIATAFHRTSEHLRTEDQASVANLTDSLASRVDTVSSYLRDTEMGAMVDDLERLARRQPAAVLGLGLILGLVGARFLKSSDRSRVNAGGLDARA